MSEASDLRAELSNPANAANIYLILLERQNAAQLDPIETTAKNVIATVMPALWRLFRIRNPQALQADDPALGALVSAGAANVDAVIAGAGAGLTRNTKPYTLTEIDDAVKITKALSDGAQL